MALEADSLTLRFASSGLHIPRGVTYLLGNIGTRDSLGLFFLMGSRGALLGQ